MKKGTKIVLGVIGVLIVGGAVAGNSGKNKSANKVGEVSSTSTNSASDTSSTEEASENKPFQVGDIVETTAFRISYLSCEEYKSDNQFIQPKDGNKFVCFEFEFENIGDSDRLVSSFDFDCFADNNNCDQKYLDSEGLDATLSPNRKTKGKVCFEVPVSAQTIELEYVNNSFTSDRIVFLYK